MTYTVGELIGRLRGLDSNALVLTASDEEGNHIRSLFAVGAVGRYYSEHNEFYENEDDYEVGEEPPYTTKAVVLWP